MKNSFESLEMPHSEERLPTPEELENAFDSFNEALLKVIEKGNSQQP